MWLPIALRNLTRNGRRTLLTLLVIALGTMMSFTVSGYINNALFTLQQSAVAQYGNFQIASPLLWEDDNQGEESLLQAEELDKIQNILSQFPEVKAYSPQLVLSGLASTETKAKVLDVMAFIPGNDALDYNTLVIEGSGLSDEVRNPVLVGTSLAKELDLEQGDFFRVTTNTIGGAYNQETLQVAGIYSRNDVQDESQLIFVPIETGQFILNTAGVSKMAITLYDLEKTDMIAAALQQQLDEAELGLEVRTWEQLSTYYRQVRGFFDMLFFFLMISVSLLVFFIVFQVLSMSFLERTKEVGTIRAIGTKRRQVFSMFFLESFLLGVLGGLLGLAIGWGLGGFFNGLNLGWTPPGALNPLPVQLSLDLSTAWVPFLVSAIATLFSAVYPSLHSARLGIVDALRTH